VTGGEGTECGEGECGFFHHFVMFGFEAKFEMI